jgi:hypothetical protein
MIQFVKNIQKISMNWVTMNMDYGMGIAGKLLLGFVEPDQI